jgi:hypothetical protein
VARQRQRLLEAYLAEVIDLNTFQRQDQTLAQQEADLLAREREVAAQGERLAGLSAITRSMTAVLQQLRVGLGQAGFEQRRQLVELLIDRVVVTNGHVEIRDVIPTTPGSTRTRFCHLRTDYFKVEPAEKRLPPAVDVGGGGADARRPQPHRLGVTVAGQMVDLQADQCALDDGQLAVVVQPADAVGEPGMQPVPAAGHRGAAAAHLRPAAAAALPAARRSPPRPWPSASEPYPGQPAERSAHLRPPSTRGPKVTTVVPGVKDPLTQYPSLPLRRVAARTAPGVVSVLTRTT